MRHVARLMTLALAVGLFAIPAASAALSIDASRDTIDDRLRSSQDTIDALVPGPIQTATSPALDASLPGDDRPLSLDASLLDAQPDLARVSMAADSTFGPTAPSVDAGGQVEGPTEAHTTDIGPIQESSNLDELPSYVTDPASSDAEENDDEAATQSKASSSPDAGSSVTEAWNSLDSEEKAAVAAGAIGLLAIGPLTLYSRIKRDDALENDTRREVYEIVEDNPGVCIQDVADTADVSYSTASYHLKRLVRMDYVTRREDGNKVLYYKNGGTFTEAERELIPVVQNEEAMRVFRHIVENPWCYRAQVAEALDVSHTTVNWHLDRLQAVDLVEEHREGRSCHLHVDDDALDRVSRVLDKIEAPETKETAPKAAPAAA